MTNYPNADNSPGYDYAADPGGLAYNNARTTGTFDLAATATTTVTDTKVQSGDVVLLTAADVEAASVMSGGAGATAGIYVSSVANGSFVVTHNTDLTGATFNYVALPSF
jgi:hypothetical protein